MKLGKIKLLNTKILLIHGNNDHTWHPKKKELMEALYPHATKASFDNCGHSPYIDQPVLFFEEVERFRAEV